MATSVSWWETIQTRAIESGHAISVTETGGRQVTRSELVSMVSAVIASLAHRGFDRGDSVLFSVRPGVDALVLVLAVHELGGVLLPTDPGVADVLFDARMKLLEPRWVFAESMLLTSPGGIASRLLRMWGVRLASLGSVAGAQFVHVGVRVPGGPLSVSFRELARGEPPPTDHARGRSTPRRATGADDPNAPSFIVCTSGTTAEPKAVVHSRRSLRAIVQAVARQLSLSDGDVMFARELHLMLPALLAGARIVIPRDLRFDAGRALSILASESVSHAFLVTRDCRLLLDACVASGRRVPATLRSLMIGAAPVRAPFLARLRDVLQESTTAWCVYGATEVLPIACISLEEKVTYSGAGDLVGAPLEGVSVRVDELGQLCVRGDRLFSGYFGQPPIDEHATGDLARLENGRIVLLGRARDMIIRGEYNIYPALYEPLVERVPGVRRAAMIGDFDAQLADERVILVVEPESGVEAGALIERVWRSVRTGPFRLDSSAQPDRIVVAMLPESGRSHKVDKVALRRALGAAACA